MCGFRNWASDHHQLEIALCRKGPHSVSPRPCKCRIIQNRTVSLSLGRCVFFSSNIVAFHVVTLRDFFSPKMSSGLDEKEADHQADALNNKEYKPTPPESISLKTPPSPDEKETNAHVAAVPDSERQYLTGFKLAVVLGSLTLISFLVLLDMSIIGTVSPPIATHDIETDH
jgi:hypothetical protein